MTTPDDAGQQDLRSQIRTLKGWIRHPMGGVRRLIERPSILVDRIVVPCCGDLYSLLTKRRTLEADMPIRQLLV